MFRNVNRLLVNILLLFMLAFAVLFSYVIFISGPLAINQQNDYDIVETMVQRNNLANATFLNRFSMDDVYYFASSAQTVYCFDEQGNVLAKIPVVTDKAQLATVASNNGFTLNDLSYGYYQKAIVYVFSTSSHEIFINTDDLTIIWELTKG